jgi:hypothetical protein
MNLDPSLRTGEYIVGNFIYDEGGGYPHRADTVLGNAAIGAAAVVRPKELIRIIRNLFSGRRGL